MDGTKFCPDGKCLCPIMNWNLQFVPASIFAFMVSLFSCSMISEIQIQAGFPSQE